jgi:hypothetical protein
MRIPLSNGGEAIVDNDRFEELLKWKWRKNKDGYAHRTAHRKGKTKRETIIVLIHRAIIGATPGQIVDHINRDRLDNRRSNLRIVNRVEHAQNRQGGHFLGVPYVTFHRQTGKFQAQSKKRYLGLFSSLQEAGKAAQIHISEEGR